MRAKQASGMPIVRVKIYVQFSKIIGCISDIIGSIEFSNILFFALRRGLSIGKFDIVSPITRYP